MAATDFILLFDALVWLMFGVPHIISDDGNMDAMGFKYAQFMPKKGKTPMPVPEEINLMLTHCLSILGSMQVAAAIMCVMAAMSKDASSKKLALKVTVAAFILITIMYVAAALMTLAPLSASEGLAPAAKLASRLTHHRQFYKPAGTGAEGSPATGPIPVIIALLIPSAAGLIM